MDPPSPQRQQSILPSPNVNEANVFDRINECHQFIGLKNWTHFHFLYHHLDQYHARWAQMAARRNDPDDTFDRAWNGLRASAVDCMLRNIEGARTYDSLLEWTKRLAEIVTDPRCLWNLLHTEVHPSLKVTLEQSHEFASHFFTPVMLFEFGLDSFLHCSLCDIGNLKTAEDLIDAFYAAAGYVRACRLDPTYRVTAPSFIDFVTRLLISFTAMPRFDGRRFVWLLESSGEHLSLPRSIFKQICEDVLDSFARQKIRDPTQHLWRFC
jgi:hypothetical protein